MYKQLLIDGKLKTGKRGKKTELLGEVHKGEKGLHCTVVPSKKEEEEEEEENESVFEVANCFLAECEICILI
jgi:hypothetical protein